MRELAILTFQTLDGVMQAPRLPDEGASIAGWGEPYWDDVMEHVGKVAMAAPYDVLLGRKTYQLFASSFPSAGDDHPMNKATKFVATSTLAELDWMNSVPITGDIAVEVARLKEQDGPLLQVHGSGELIQTLMFHGLIDEYRLWTFPVVVGSGQRLFREGSVRMGLNLIRTEPCASGAIMSIYRPADRI
jgi:dihydrofolate reductase